MPGATGERKGKAMNATKMGLYEALVRLWKSGDIEGDERDAVGDLIDDAAAGNHYGTWEHDARLAIERGAGPSSVACSDCGQRPANTPSPICVDCEACRGIAKWRNS